MNEETDKTFETYFIESGASKLNIISSPIKTAEVIELFNKKIAGLKELTRTAFQGELKQRLKKEKVPEYHRITGAAFKPEDKEDADEEIPEIFIPPKPWPEEVIGEELLVEISSLISKYIILPEGAADTIALYIVSSYFIQDFDVFPFLHITSPSKGCGKSRLLEIIAGIVFKGLVIVNPSIAFLYRGTDKFGFTTCLDEVDQSLKVEGVSPFFTSCYTKLNAEGFFRCTEKGGIDQFKAWSVKILAGIGELKDDTLRSRCIRIPMKKKMSHETVERLRTRRIKGVTTPIARKLTRFRNDHSDQMKELMDSDIELPAKLLEQDRPSDNWEPLIAAGDICGPFWGKKARELSLLSIGDDSTDTASNGENLLSDMKDIFEDYTEHIYTETLVEKLNALDERSWSGWNHNRGMQAKDIARMLKPFGVKSKNIQSDGKQLKGYKRVDFGEVFDRYLPSQVDGRTDGRANKDASTPPLSQDSLKDKDLENQENLTFDDEDPPF